jgi:hypothetical protein
MDKREQERIEQERRRKLAEEMRPFFFRRKQDAEKDKALYESRLGAIEAQLASAEIDDRTRRRLEAARRELKDAIADCNLLVRQCDRELANYQ